jgi:hypothetical protein
MAIAERHLITRLILAVIACSAWSFTAFGASANEASSPRQFRVLAIGDPVPLGGLLYDLNGKSVHLHASDVSLSTLYEAPKTDPLVLYREIPPPPPETKPRRVPVLSVDLGSRSPALLVLKATPSGTVTSKVIDDSWDSFPPQTVRVLSFSRRSTAAQIEGNNAELPPLGFHIFPYSSAKPRIRVKVASLNGGTWKLQFNNSQAVLPGYRINMVVLDFEPTPQDPEPEGVNVLKMIDPLSPPQDTQLPLRR